MAHEEEKKEDHLLLSLRQTRRAFLVEYFCSFLLLGIGVAVYLHAVPIRQQYSYLIGALGLLSLISAESSILATRYKIYNTKFSIIHGLIKHQKKNVYFQPLAYVPDLNIHQSRVQRPLNYGTVFIKTVGETFEIRNITHPQKVLVMIEELVKQNKQ